MTVHVVSKDTNFSVQPEAFYAEPIRMQTRRRQQTPNDAVIMTEFDVDTTPVKKTGSYTERYVSNRKAITEDEKNNALMLAEAAASDASFKVVMRPSRVQEILSVSPQSMGYKKHPLSQPRGNTACWKR